MENSEPKFVYGIYGRTQTHKFACASFGTMKFVIESFLEKYPRFKGTAQIWRAIPNRSMKELSWVKHEDQTIVVNFDSSKKLRENKEFFMEVERNYLLTA